MNPMYAHMLSTISNPPSVYNNDETGKGYKRGAAGDVHPQPERMELKGKGVRDRCLEGWSS